MLAGDSMERISTGLNGLDEILRGGLTPNRLYLIEGNPGSGKTTLSLQFLIDGAKRGEQTLYISLSETRNEIEAIARSHGWTMDNIHIQEMRPEETELLQDRQVTMYHPSEIELGQATQVVLKRVEELRPVRVVFDSLSEMRLLAQNALRYRRQILALKHFFVGRKSTVIMIDDLTAPGEDLQLQSIAHGVISLEQLNTEYGTERRQLRVTKMRGIEFLGGLHDYVIRRGGLKVFPRLVASSQTRKEFPDADVSTGNAELNQLTGGGLTRGSSTLLIGPAGSGKSTMGMQFCVEAARRNERSVIYLFDETVRMLTSRTRKLGFSIDKYLSDGLITLVKVNPAEMSAGEFAWLATHAAGGSDANGRAARVVMIDSINGYLNSMSQEKQLLAQLHELFTHLNQSGVISLVTMAQSGMTGQGVKAPIDTTYLADNVIMFRFFECFGEVRRAISVLKKRSGVHEQTIREFSMNSRGLRIGPPLSQFQGVLNGTPTYHGEREHLVEQERAL